MMSTRFLRVLRLNKEGVYLNLVPYRLLPTGSKVFAYHNSFAAGPLLLLFANNDVQRCGDGITFEPRIHHQSKWIRKTIEANEKKQRTAHNCEGKLFEAGFVQDANESNMVNE